MEPNTQIVKASQSKEVEFVPIGSRDPIKLSVAIVKNFIAQKTRSGAEASDADCMKFVMLCKVRGLDPWQGDAYLQGYDSSNGPTFTLITAHQAFLKRAEINKSFDGMQSGVVCIDEDGNLVEYEGDLVLQGHTLIGGWARVHKKDLKFPVYKRLKLSTFNSDRSRWKVDPAGMIVKCTEADALRTAFPTSLGGLYIDAEVQSVIDITPAGDVPQAPKRKSLPKFDAKPAAVVEEAAQQEPEQSGTAYDTGATPEPTPEPRKMSGCISSLSKSIINAGFTFEDLIEVLSKHPKYTARIAEIKQWTDITDDEAKEIIGIVDVSNGQLKLKAPRRQAAPAPTTEGQL